MAIRQISGGNVEQHFSKRRCTHDANESLDLELPQVCGATERVHDSVTPHTHSRAEIWLNRNNPSYIFFKHGSLSYNY